MFQLQNSKLMIQEKKEKGVFNCVFIFCFNLLFNYKTVILFSTCFLFWKNCIENTKNNFFSSLVSVQIFENRKQSENLVLCCNYQLNQEKKMENVFSKQRDLLFSRYQVCRHVACYCLFLYGGFIVWTLKNFYLGRNGERSQ